MKRARKEKGFTLLELVVVIIVIGILATIGLTQYTKMAERGRGAEARSILGSLRSAEEFYRTENNAYTGTLNQLAVDVPAACQVTHYFSYAVALAGNGFTATATRCTTGGKNPNYVGTASLVLNVVSPTSEPTWISTPPGQY